MRKTFTLALILLTAITKAQELPCSVLPPEFYCNSITVLDTVDFTIYPSEIIIDTVDTTNIWQIGHSYKPVFDSIISPLGIVTDSITPYSNNLKSSFTLNIGDMGWPSILMFEHQYDTDSLVDGGYIEYSLDNGVNWLHVNESDPYHGAPSDISYYNYVNMPWGPDISMLHDTIPSFTGSSDGWIWSGIQWIWWIALSNHVPAYKQNDFGDSVLVRFTFESDSINTGKAGWMIRNIITGWTDQIGSINEWAYNPLKIYPNPASNKVFIDLPLGISQNSIIEIYDMMGRLVLNAPVSRDFDVSDLNKGTYLIKLSTDDEVSRSILVKDQ